MAISRMSSISDEACRQGDTLFTFLMIELACDKGCDARAEAVRRRIERADPGPHLRLRGPVHLRGVSHRARAGG